ncbi:sorting nexin-16 isoform X4 [Octopus bimaculoides]|uniref:sorting nexin-16 isoform X4 n=1 Tax=Octopus bimaculoides TaxID=37653 RepID=UPI0022E48F5C|nr:sorting nexin-16 isoform X4 [Octopus bimaculoides]
MYEASSSVRRKRKSQCGVITATTTATTTSAIDSTNTISVSQVRYYLLFTLLCVLNVIREPNFLSNIRFGQMINIKSMAANLVLKLFGICLVSPEQSMEKEFGLDKNINVVKPCSSKVYLLDRSKVQYAEGDLDSAEEVMEDSKLSNDAKNIDFSTPVSPSSTRTKNSRSVSQGSLDSLDKQRGNISYNDDGEFYISAYSNIPVQVPIIGYETMEQRARFTVFKLQVIHSPHDSWFVFRRYTDFVQLSDKITQLQLKNISPTFLIPLPPKRWFGDNFDRHFLEDRQRGLQDFINKILKNKILCECAPVREFFCFDDPPGPHDSLEESRALCESLEEQTYNLKKELKDKEHEIDLLKAELNLCKSQIEDLKKFDKLHINSKSCDLELTPPSRPNSGSNDFLNECPEVDQNSFEEPVESNTQ